MIERHHLGRAMATVTERHLLGKAMAPVMSAIALLLYNDGQCHQDCDD